MLAQLTLGAAGCTEPTFVDAEDDGDDQAEESRAQDAAGGESDDGSVSDHDDAGSASAGDGGVDAAEGLLDAASANDAASPLDAASAGDGAAQSKDPASEAGAGSPLPSWAAPLIGTYAKRSVTFSYDDSSLALFGPINTRNVEYSIVTISQRGEELALSIELCAYRILATDTSEFYFKNPAGMPKLSGRILLEAPNRFSSERMVHSLGFDPARGASCGASGRRARYEDQTWSSAMCECRASPLPDSLNDCRVVDGDSDARPGITGRGGYSSSTPTDVVFAFQYALTFSEGTIKADQGHELHELRTQTQECLNASADRCNFGNNTLCPGGTTKLLHQEGATCANFPEDEFGALPAFPTVPDCRG